MAALDAERYLSSLAPSAEQSTPAAAPTR